MWVQFPLFYSLLCIFKCYVPYGEYNFNLLIYFIPQDASTTRTSHFRNDIDICQCPNYCQDSGEEESSEEILEVIDFSEEDSQGGDVLSPPPPPPRPSSSPPYKSHRYSISQFEVLN